MSMNSGTNMSVRLANRLQSTNDLNQVHVCIIGDKDASVSIQHSRKLFEPFQYQFDRFHMVSDLIRDTFKLNDRLSVCALHRNTFLDEHSKLDEQGFHDQSVLYLLLIPCSSPIRDLTNSLKYYEVPNLSESNSSIYIRVTDCNVKVNSRSFDIIPILDVKPEITIRELIHHALTQLKLSENVHQSRMFYYGYELDRNICPLSSNDLCWIISQNKMPIIFDLVLSPLKSTELKSKKDLVAQHALSLVSVEGNPLISQVSLNIGQELRLVVSNNQDSSIKNNLVQFYGNFAFILYIRLRIIAKINQKSVLDSFSDNLVYKYVEERVERNQLREALANLFVFCDKDKSNELDENESTIALLILFNYLNRHANTNKKPQLNYSSLLPICYGYYQRIDKRCYQEKDFETLVIDILTEHIRIHSFQAPNYLEFDETHNHNDLIDGFCDSIETVLTKQLKPTIDVQHKSPFTVPRLIVYIGLLLLSIIMLPITSILLYFKARPKKFLFIKIILMIFVTLLAYFIIINVIFFHVFYDENILWRVNSLEVYWPFALMIFFYILIFRYIHEEYLQSQNEIDQNAFQNSQEYAETEMLKHRAMITTNDRQRMTVHQYESITKTNSTTKSFSLAKIKEDHFTINAKESTGTQYVAIIGKIFLLSVVFLITMTHPFIPMIYRNHFSNKTDPEATKPFQVDIIQVSYIVLSLPFYFLFILMIIYAFYQYNNFYSALVDIFKKIANESDYTNCHHDFYLNLKFRDNLDLFLSLIRNQYKKHDSLSYQIAYWTIIGALLFGLILAGVAFIRLLYYGFGGMNTLTSAFILIDIIILTILVSIFLIGLVLINELTTNTLLQLLLRTKKEALSDQFRKNSLDKQWNIHYLGATAEYLKENQDLYTIKICGFIINRELAVKAITPLLGGVFTAFGVFVKKRLGFAE